MLDGKGRQLHPGPYLGRGGAAIPGSAHLSSFQHYFNVSLQLQYCIFFSPEAFCDAQKVLKRCWLGELTTLPRPPSRLGRGTPLLQSPFGASFQWTLSEFFSAYGPGCIRRLSARRSRRRYSDLRYKPTAFKRTMANGLSSTKHIAALLSTAEWAGSAMRQNIQIFPWTGIYCSLRAPHSATNVTVLVRWMYRINPFSALTLLGGDRKGI